MLFYVPLFLMALFLVPGISSGAPALERLARYLPCWMTTVLLTILFALIGLYWTHFSGAHSGDEGHYLVQAVSLHEDGDLDIRNNLEKEIGAGKVSKIGRDTFHVSPFSRGSHWYSFHAPGLPFILAPFVPGGMAARHLVLGLIAALTVCAVWCLCRRAGASLTAAVVVSSGFFGSLYGIVYASRCLPEMLGACLIAWLCWCVFVQEDFPWRSAVLGAFCCAFLPWVYVRFYPAALMGIILYGAAAARMLEAPAREAPRDKPRGFFAEPCEAENTIHPCGKSQGFLAKKGKIARLGLFLCLSVGGILYYKYIQEIMYEGGSAHAVSEVLFSYPLGFLYVFTNKHAGLLNVFPLAIGLVAAGLAFPFVSPSRRGMALAFGLMFGTVWLTSCGGSNYFGGATLGRRFLFAVVPILLPGMAVLWDRVSIPARWWLILLALVSMALCVFELIYLPKLGRSFAYPYKELPVVAPFLAGLPTPFCGTLHAIVVASLTLCLMGLRRYRPAALTVGLIIVLSLVWQIAVGMGK